MRQFIVNTPNRFQDSLVDAIQNDSRTRVTKVGYHPTTVNVKTLSADWVAVRDEAGTWRITRRRVFNRYEQVTGRCADDQGLVVTRRELRAELEAALR